MTGGFPNFHELLSNTWGLILMVLLFEGSIFVHELGHFLTARRFGLKVERFSLGFGPRLFGWKGRDGVEYRVSLLPLGGYVSLPQLADLRALEGEPAAEMQNLPPVSYFAKMMVFGAGAFFNVLFALAIAFLLWGVGVPAPMGFDTNVIGYVSDTIPALPGQAESPGPAFAAGLRAGDRILAVDGRPVRDFRDIQSAVALGAGRTADGQPLVHLTYHRAGQTLDMDLKPVLQEMNDRSHDAMRQIGILPAYPLIINEISPGSPAERAGLANGDTILALNRQPVLSIDGFRDAINQGGAHPVILTVRRAGATADTPVAVSPVRVPWTTPLASFHLDGANGTANATLDLAPLFADGATGNLASPAAPAIQLAVARIEGDGNLFGSLQAGDTVTEINGQPVHSVQAAVNAFAGPAGQPAKIKFTAFADGQKSSVTLPPAFAAKITPPEEHLMVGLLFQDTTVEHAPPWRQFNDAVEQTVAMLRSLFNPHSDVGIRDLSGPVYIARVLYRFSENDIRLALWFTFILNINLAIINLLPIPVLDGGHMVMATIARLRGRALPLRLVTATQGLFLVLIMGLMLFKIFQDTLRWLGDNDADRQAMQVEVYDLPKLTFPPAPPAPTKP
jgi:regulator of sigma E protease